VARGGSERRVVWGENGVKSEAKPKVNEKRRGLQLFSE